MSFNQNSFATLDDHIEQCSTPDVKEVVVDQIIPPVFSRISKIAWADADDDDPIDFPIMGSLSVSDQSFLTPATGASFSSGSLSPTKISMSQEEKDAMKKFDVILSKKRHIQVTHAVRVYNKDTKQVSTENNTRRFQVVTKGTYETLSRLITRYKTHKNSGNGVDFNRKEQAEKIKFTNTLMSYCYKDPSVPACFIYSVVIIKLESGNTLTRNEIRTGSRCPFEFQNITHYPNYVSQGL